MITNFHKSFSLLFFTNWALNICLNIKSILSGRIIERFGKMQVIKHLPISVMIHNIVYTTGFSGEVHYKSFCSFYFYHPLSAWLIYPKKYLSICISRTSMYHPNPCLIILLIHIAYNSCNQNTIEEQQQYTSIPFFEFMSCQYLQCII